LASLVVHWPRCQLTELGAIVIREALARTKSDPATVGEVIMGQVLAAGAGSKPGASSHAQSRSDHGNVPALTINAVCGSGLKSVMLAAQAVAWGDSEIVVAGGQENMSASAPRPAWQP
jgi:acetyl-CoA C-acetyltransferase